METNIDHQIQMYTNLSYIVKDFTKLLTNANYANEKLNKLEMLVLENKSNDITHIITYILITIYNISNNFNKYEKSIENTIINYCLHILWNDNNIKNVINKMNKLIEHKFKPIHIEEHKKAYGFDIILNYERFTEININNIEYVYNDFAKYVHLNRLRKKMAFEQYNEFENIDTYLFCLHHFPNLYV
jgi:hypothetical protein